MAMQLYGATQYYEKIRLILDQVFTTQTLAFHQTAQAGVQTIQQGGKIYLFGTGHSHMLAEEGHFRAGGLAPVIPILNSSLMVHESAINSGKLERLPGLAATVLSRYQPTAKDLMVIFSNSGVNAVPVEMALEAQKMGMTVVGILALAYAAVAPLSTAGKRLDEIADIVLDNKIPAGDALVEIGQHGLHSGPASTVIGAFILDAILTEVAYRLEATGNEPPVYISSNMPGAREHNQNLLDHEKYRNPHL